MALGKQRPQAKNKLPVNKNVLAAIVAVIIAAIAFFNMRPSETIITTKFVDNYGHMMRIEEKDGIKSIVDDPECKKCQKITHDITVDAIICAFDSMEVRIVP